MKIGVESISIYTPRYYLDLRTLAEARGVDPAKYYHGIGQEKMAISPPDEDVVSMGATAAQCALEQVDARKVDTVMFATESGVDQSKAAGIYVHELVGLPSNCRAFELKQACCSSTAGLLMALALVQQRPKKKVLIVASDIARYKMNTPGEATQGAGAVAMVISADPKLVAFEPESGSYTEDVMDFWRPNYLEEALVDGKYSIKVYLHALLEAWKDYTMESGRRFEDHYRFCYHLPFTRMAEKAHQHLARHVADGNREKSELMAQIEPSLRYNRIIGNSYTGSLYVALTSLLEGEPGLAGQRIGMFSYGSGCMGAFFSGIVQPGYEKHLQVERHRRVLDDRTELRYDEYEAFYEHHLPTDGTNYRTPTFKTGRFRLAGIQDHKRVYAACVAEAGAETRTEPKTRTREAVHAEEQGRRRELKPAEAA